MRIMRLTLSTWKVRKNKARSAVETTPCCPPPIPFTGQRAKLIARVLTRNSFLVTFILSSFILLLNSQLTVFHTSGLVLASSILRILDLEHHERHVPKRYVNYA